MQSKKKKNLTRTLFILFGIAVPVLNFLVFYLYANFSSFTMAFTNNRGELSFDNFLRLWKALSEADSDLRVALKNTLLMFGVLVVQFPFQVLVSYFLYKKVPGHKFYRIVFFLPTIIFSVAVSMVFKQMVGTNGFIAKAIGDLMGLDYVPDLLADSRFANATVIIQWLWLKFPGDLIIWGGTFARIPEEVLESARVDGVNWWQEFTKIIVPMVWPTVALKMVLLGCGLFSASGNVWLLTRGQYGTETIVSWMYNTLQGNSGAAYASNVYNYLSAVGLVITVIAVTLSSFIRKWTDRVFEEVEF